MKDSKKLVINNSICGFCLFPKKLSGEEIHMNGCSRNRGRFKFKVIIESDLDLDTSNWPGLAKLVMDEEIRDQLVLK